MPQQADKESKTEEPTEKKILDEVERGNIPISREASLFATSAATLAICAFLAPDLLRSISSTLERLSNDPGGWLLRSSADARELLTALAWEISRPLIPPVIVLMAAGLASTFFQHAPHVVLDRIRPNLNRISLVNGWRRIFGASGRTEFIKSVGKLLSIGIVLLVVFRGQQYALIGAMSVDPNAIPEFILMIAMRLLMAVCVVTVLLLAADLFWVRAHWRRDIRMTRQEVKDELKDLEGDPLRKARLRSLALDRRRKSMIAAVPRATLVIANPTHYAVALRYLREEGGAPMVLSKGKDLVALKIREIAGQHSIPIIEDKPLAKSMYDSVEVDRPIPPEFYKAVAEIIHILYAKSSRRASAK
ncbi:MAG: flagellar type III secretion system protein FlhB [Beijerinckiaceae bacterium]|nr:flagellar type III secretion system protein FlhB [Beijerinckiaceae bacterium]MCI0737287.1 flagellar type III secretion system protein FlhB [Beijerinckiaceae bacterium]